MKIYTRKGDVGETALFGGRRVPKHELRIEAYGTVDELNSWVGVVRDVSVREKDRMLLKKIQETLFSLGANLATDPNGKTTAPIQLADADVQLLEQSIDEMEQSLEPLRSFILPGGHMHVSYCHVARTVCRRAERLVVALHTNEGVDPIAIRYLNRLSDFLFVYARHLAAQLGIEETKWNAG